MKGFWNKENGLENELRSRRVEPQSEFVASVAERVRPRRASARGMRIGVAIALTIAMLAALAPIGAASYAGGAAASLVSAATSVLGPAAHHGKSAAKSPASAQYLKKKKCKKGWKRKGNKCIKVKHKTKAARAARRGPRFTG